MLLTILVTVGGIAADERGARTLPKLLREERLRIKERAVAASMARPVLGVLRIGLVVGYLAALVATAFFVPFSPWIYLVITLGWSALTVFDAPHVISRASSLLYETSLLLNGVVLALCFFSPLSGRLNLTMIG